MPNVENKRKDDNIFFMPCILSIVQNYAFSGKKQLIVKGIIASRRINAGASDKSHGARLLQLSQNCWQTNTSSQISGEAQYYLLENADRTSYLSEGKNVKIYSKILTLGGHTI
jgi:hypothetical protein